MKSFGSYLVIICLCLCGCEPARKLVPVTGQVTVSGKPASGAVIMFHPEDETQAVASGVADTEGKFKLVSGGDSGLMIGRYKVTVIWPDPSKKPTEAQIMMGTADAGPDLLKSKYALDKTPLTTEITESTVALAPFEL